MPMVPRAGPTPESASQQFLPKLSRAAINKGLAHCENARLSRTHSTGGIRLVCRQPERSSKSGIRLCSQIALAIQRGKRGLDDIPGTYFEVVPKVSAIFGKPVPVRAKHLYHARQEWRDRADD